MDAVWILLAWISLGLATLLIGPRLIPRESMGAILLMAVLGLAGYLAGDAIATLAGSDGSLPAGALLLAVGAMLVLLIAYRRLRKA